MASELIKAVRSLRNLEHAWSVIQRNGYTSKSEGVRLELEKFSENSPSNLRSIKGKLSRGSFNFLPSKGILVPKTDENGRKTGKSRPLVLAPVESRIVQRAILDVLLDVPELEPYIKSPYSFGGIRGDRGSQKDKGPRYESVSAVPAAIFAVLGEIGSGARFVACADIRTFFTRISKDAVTKIVASAVNDEEFIGLFSDAIHVELSNMAQLRGKSASFPIEDIGVAQGNSLSPLLGNIILSEFDELMNEGDCRCIRYIDDFIILAPTKKAATARLRKAAILLQTLGMELSPEKTSKGGFSIDEGFDFLGINICPGAVRPSSKAQAKLIRSVQSTFDNSLKAMRAIKHGQPFDRANSLTNTLKRVDGIVDGWGKHYWFCNDLQSFENLDNKINDLIRRFLGEYSCVRNEVAVENRRYILGVSQLRHIPRDPFVYPKLGKSQETTDL